MANIVITSDTKSVIVDFGDFANLSQVDGRKATYKRDDISVIWLEKDDAFVNVKMKDAVTTTHWKLSFSGDAGVFIVDSIDGTPPTSNTDLFDKLNALR